LEDANRIDQAIVDIERLRQEIQMAPSQHEQLMERASRTFIDGGSSIPDPFPEELDRQLKNTNRNAALAGEPVPFR
jgi:hypothetical protein